jgi:hypothetical protein
LLRRAELTRNQSNGQPARGNSLEKSEGTERSLPPLASQRRCGMVNAQSIKEHMEVIGSDGAHVGTVDNLEGSDKIKLTKSDAKSGGQHHIIPLAWVDKVDDKVRLKKSAKAAMADWQTAA